MQEPTCETLVEGSGEGNRRRNDISESWAWIACLRGQEEMDETCLCAYKVHIESRQGAPLQPCSDCFLPPIFSALSSFAMMDEMMRSFSSEQLAFITEHFVPKVAPPPPPPLPPPSTIQSPLRSWADESEEPQLTQAAESEQAHAFGEQGSELGGPSISTGVAGNVVGEASSSSDSVRPLPPESSDDEENLGGPHPSKKYECEGWTCRADDGEPVFFERSVLVIKGCVQKPGGPEVPGYTWQGLSNRLCVECFIAKYEANASPEHIEDVRREWKRTCRHSHRQAQKYIKKKKMKAEEDRSDTLRKHSKQQQDRCGRWSVAMRDIQAKYPGVRSREYRNLVLKKVQSVLASVVNSLSLWGAEGKAAVADAQQARIAHLTKLAEDGVCGLPDGKHLKDLTLQFLSDLSPDGNNKELFLCRGCGFVHHNHQWHQEQGKYGMNHHFRCRNCHRQYDPWKKDGRFCKFNKVLLNQDPADKDKFIATPAWWTETSEQLFINILKEYTLKIKIGSTEMDKVTYDNISKVISEHVEKSYNQPTIFQTIRVPAPVEEQVAVLSACRGYEHCDTSPQDIEGFFFKNHMAVTEEEIFTDFEVLCNEIASCFKMDKV